MSDWSEGVDTSMTSNTNNGSYMNATETSSGGSFLDSLLGLLGIGGSGGTNLADMKMLGMMGAGIASLIENNNRAPQPLKQPKYTPAPVYDRALTAPMRDVNSMGEKLYFNPNPFQLNATEAAKQYGPTLQEIAAARNAYQQGLASLYASKPTTRIGTMYTPGKQLAASLGRTPTMAEMVRGYNQGGPVVGPGDGMSDSVPAVANGAQPAALSDGEYVLPASFVSAVGNGSTRAGVAKIQSMVDRVMQAKYGSTDPTPAPL